MASTPNVMVATPAYGGAVQVAYLMSLIGYQAENIQFSVVAIGNESLITRARNTLAATFHAREQYTHLLFLDADVGLPAAGLLRMLSRQKDVVGAPVALKGRNPDGTRVFNVGRSLGEDGALTLHERIGTAALLLSRAAVGALVEDAKERGDVYERASTQIGEEAVPIHYDIFRVGVVDGEYLSEDYWACATLRRLGFAIHVDPTVVTTHHGTVSV